MNNDLQQRSYRFQIANPEAPTKSTSGHTKPDPRKHAIRVAIEEAAEQRALAKEIEGVYCE